MRDDLRIRRCFQPVRSLLSDTFGIALRAEPSFFLRLDEVEDVKETAEETRGSLLRGETYITGADADV